MRRDIFTTTNAVFEPRESSSGAIVRVLLIVEGSNDIEFLRRISLLLHAHDSSLPNLAEMEQRGELIFIPFGGGDVRAWTHRLSPLGKPEFYLIDRELPPEKDYRYEAAQIINDRDNCRAVLTSKRSIENYIHSSAICAAGEIELEFGDFDSVAELTAQVVYHRGLKPLPWECLPRRARRRLSNRAKRWLNTQAVAEMTIQMLRESDPQDEIIAWFRMIRELVNPTMGHRRDC